MNNWYKSPYFYAIYLLTTMLFLQGCGSSGFMLRTATDQQYTPSSTPISEILTHLQTQSPPNSFSGSGKIFFSAPGQSERLSFEYVVSQDREVYQLKNRIGIPVAAIQVEVDSVLFLDRLESRAIKWHKNSPPLSLPGIIPPIRLYELIHYDLWIAQANEVNESEEDIRLTIPGIGYVYLDVETYALSRLYYTSSTRRGGSNDSWKLQVNDRKNYNNSPIARTFSIENETRKSQLFMQLIQLQFSESMIPPPLSIPSNYTQIR